MRKIQSKLLLTDIRFWIIVFFIIRLIGITNAPIEIGHNWRQSLTNMIARNFLEVDANIFYPRIDMSGNGTGIIGSEFPLFNYLIFLISEIFGYAHWYGRLLNLIVSSIGIYFFYRLAEKLYDKKFAFISSVILLCSIWFSFSRKIMPDTFSVSIVIIGLYYAYMYITTGDKLKLLPYFLFISLGGLCKIPALSIVAALSVIVIIKDISFTKKAIVLGIAALSAGIVSLWYFYWVPYLLRTYGYQLYFPKGLYEGLQEIIPLWPLLLERFYFSSFNSFVAFVVFLAGFICLVLSEDKYSKIGLAIITTVFLIFILKTGEVFPHHSYYIIPFTPIMSLVAGYGLLKVRDKYVYLILCAISFEAIANQHDDFFVPKGEIYKLSLENSLNKLIKKNELIVINGTQSPQQIYFSHRKGWTIDNDLINKPSIEKFKQMGAAYLIINTKSYKKSIDYFPKVLSENHYDVYQLRN